MPCKFVLPLLILFANTGLTQPSTDKQYLDSIYAEIMTFRELKFNSLEAMDEFRKDTFHFGNGNKFPYLRLDSLGELAEISNELEFPFVILNEKRFQKVMTLLDQYRVGENVHGLYEKELETQIATLLEMGKLQETKSELLSQRFTEMEVHYQVLRSDFNEMNALAAKSIDMNELLDKKLKKRNRWNFVLASGLAAVLVTSILSISSN